MKAVIETSAYLLTVSQVHTPWPSDPHNQTHCYKASSSLRSLFPLLSYHVAKLIQGLLLFTISQDLYLRKNSFYRSYHFIHTANNFSLPSIAKGLAVRGSALSPLWLSGIFNVSKLAAAAVEYAGQKKISLFLI